MARPDYLSPTAWALWEKCPRAWEQRYLEGRKDPGSIHTVTGRIVHRALEMLMSLGPQHRTRQMRGVAFEASWEEHLAEVQEMQLDETAARKAVDECAEGAPLTEPAAASAADVLAVEEDHLIEVAGVPVRVIVDRVDRVEDKRKGPLALPIDYKSGAKMRSDIGYTRQMVLSSIAAERSVGLPAPRAELRYVRLGQTKAVPTGDGARRTVMEDLKRAWRSMAAAEIDGTFDTRPSPLCAWCPYLEDCPDRRARAMAAPHLARARG